MDVRCNRCDTEYEFDDALISERGTTVKCTNCGFQFKIHPAKGAGLAPERWVVRTASGRELVYTSLRELQRGIADKKVVASDLLSRGKQTPRALGSIAELEPLFQVTQATQARMSGNLERAQRTLHGVAPPQSEFHAYRSEPPPAAAPEHASRTPAEGTPASPSVAPEAREQPPPATQHASGTPQSRDAAPASAALSPDTAPSTRPTSLEQSGIFASTPSADSVSEGRGTLPNGSGAHALTSREPRPLTSNATPKPRAVAESAPDSTRSSFLGTPMSPRVAPFDNALEASTATHAPVSSPRNLPPLEVASIRDSFKSYDELRMGTLPEDHHARVARSRWIAGVVVIGVLGLLGATVGRRFLAQLTGAAAVNASSDTRVAKFLADGARFSDDGDFEGAKEEFDKATALAERDPAVLTALARLATLRADISWLKLRIIDPNSSDLVQATYRELGQSVGRARVAVDRAFAVSPEAPAVLRARVDALRLSGEADKAREWLAPLSANASVPENAYVLAALDLADPAPVWPSVIDRLHTAAAAEREPGRARAALIYALARADRIGEAEAEFTKIDRRSKPHPLLEELRAFLLRAKRSLEAAGSTKGKLAAVDTSKLPRLDTSLSPEEARLPAGDLRTRLEQASAALEQGAPERAAELYDSVLTAEPSNAEALAGLAAIAKARHDSARAARSEGPSAGATTAPPAPLETGSTILPEAPAAPEMGSDASDRPGEK